MKKRIITIGLAVAATACIGWADRKLSLPSDGIEIAQACPKKDARGVSETREEILKAKIRESAYGSRIRAANRATVPEVKVKDDNYDYKPGSMPEYVKKSLDWLAQAQHDNGGWGGGASSRSRNPSGSSLRTSP